MEIKSSNETYQISNNTKNENTENKNTQSFEDLISKNNNEEKKTETRTADELTRDIISLLKTGLTPGEIEAVEELLRELKDKINEGDYSEKEIENMLSNIEKEIQAIKKRITGQVIEKVDENAKLKEDKSNDETSLSKIDFFNRIDTAMMNLEALKTGKTKIESSLPLSNSSELLEMIKDFQR